jgi:hypothetical protein
VLIPMRSPVRGLLSSPALRKAAAAAATTATTLAWKRLGWQARAALAGGSMLLGAAKKLNSIRHRLTGAGSSGAKKGGRGFAASALESGREATPALSPAAEAYLAQRQAGNPLWSSAVRQALGQAH